MIPEQVRIFLCTTPVDMRFGFDRLCRVLADRTQQEPQQGGLFVFSNKAATRLKLLWFEKNGVCLLYKRSHRARFVVPLGDGGASMVIERGELAKLLEGQAHEGKRAKRRLTVKPIVSTSDVDAAGHRRRSEAQSA